MMIKQVQLIMLLIVLCVCSSNAQNKYINRLAIKSGISGSSPLIGLEYQMVYKHVGVSLTGAVVSSNTANFYPVRFLLILPLVNQEGVEPYALLGGGMSWTVPSDAIGASIVTTPSLEFGAGINKSITKTFGASFEMSQSAELVNNEWTGRKDWLFFQYWKLGVWFEI